MKYLVNQGLYWCEVGKKGVEGNSCKDFIRTNKINEVVIDASKYKTAIAADLYYKQLQRELTQAKNNLKAIENKINKFNSDSIYCPTCKKYYYKNGTTTIRRLCQESKLENDAIVTVENIKDCYVCPKCRSVIKPKGDK